MELLGSLPEKIKNGLYQAADIVSGHRTARIVSHYDADGISSAAIIREALSREGIQTDITIFTTLSEGEMEEVDTFDDGLIIFTDMGTSYVGRICSGHGDVVILDHHRFPKDFVLPERKGFCFVSPHLCDIDGSKEICGAGMSYLFSLALNEKNEDLVSLAMAGMFGDKQNLGGFTSLNDRIVKHAVEKGLVRKLPVCPYPAGLGFGISMMYCTDPYLRGITGDHRAIGSFLGKLGMDEMDDSLSVSGNTLKTFGNAVVGHMRESKVSENIISEVLEHRYWSEKYGMDIAYLGMILDGCGRTAEYDTAFDACGSGNFDDAVSVGLGYYRGIVRMTEKTFSGLKQMENIQYFMIEEPSMTGNMCSALMRYLADPEKPTVGLGISDATRTNLSSRGTSYLVSKGLNLTVAMHDAAAEAGGSGGGHVIASGGDIPKGSENVFLNALDRIVGTQFRASSNKGIE